MEGLNTTIISEFILLGITDLPWLQKVLFVPVLAFYLLDILGNLTIICLVVKDATLHSPMYFFLANLSFLDMLFSSNTIPKMLVGIWMEKTISIKNCIAQMYFFHFLGCSEGLLLAFMGYDRYVAICQPLRYVVIMAKNTCIQLVLVSWIAGLTSALINAIMTSRLPFCNNNNKVKHFFCDVKPVIRLACKDIHINEITMTIVSGFLSISTFSLTILSYCYIVAHVIKMHSSQGRTKAFSTCSAHLTIVILFYGTAMCTYLGPSSETSIEKDRIAAILFTVITPAINPIIYTLRNKDIRKSLRKYAKYLMCRAHMSNTRPAGRIRPTSPCHVALSPSCAARSWQKSISPPPAFILGSHAPLSLISTEVFCVYKGQICFQWLPQIPHSRARWGQLS
ncbi:olfactory receptor 12D1-like [Aquarana catesbeiana]|uniref:olfactory receptor 12D1-like n=1 Tax=Aquarana catesbeiana TaxID=8400 RepID=UPI003CC9DD77